MSLYEQIYGIFGFQLVFFIKQLSADSIDLIGKFVFE